MTGATGSHEVLLTDGAQRDLASIYDYIAEFDCVENADHVLDQLMAEAQKLAAFPDRGSCPKELSTLGLREYRQTLFKPYRLIYRVLDLKVIIYLIADGRRDMQSLLMQRLLSV